MFRPMFAIALLATCLVTSQAWAQPEGGRGAGSRREAMAAKVMEILTPDQKSKLEALRGPAFDVSSLQLRGRRRAAAN
jgi:hypothetical protein